MSAFKHTAYKIVMAAYKIAALEQGQRVEFGGSFWELHDQADITGLEHKRGRKVLREIRVDGKIDDHYQYKWPGIEGVQQHDTPDAP